MPPRGISVLGTMEAFLPKCDVMAGEIFQHACMMVILKTIDGGYDQFKSVCVGH